MIIYDTATIDQEKIWIFSPGREIDVTLEKEIKQKKPFKSQREKALVNVLYTYNWVNEILLQFFKPYGITPTQYNILRILKGSEQPLSTSAIRDRMINKMSDITRLIDRLIKKNYVVKKKRKVDRRLVDITITDIGKKVLDDIMRLDSPGSIVMQNLAEEEAEILNELLDRLRM